MPATLDTKGMNCPLPVLKAKKAIKDIPVGDILRVLATDPSAKRDFQSYCRSTGYELLESKEEGGVFVFVIRKTAP
jgi:tRNA 2-thiouridine synthesizing protein A